MREGLRIIARHPVVGVGAGQYARVDPVHTSPHSLPLLVQAELGIAGTASLALLSAFFASRALRVRPWRTRLDDADLLATGCIAGASAFLLKGLVAGSVLVTGMTDTWVTLIVLFAAILAVEPS